MSTVDIGAVTLDAMTARADELCGAVVRTPVVRLNSPLIEHRLGDCTVHMKLECFQHTGSFKARGALSVAGAIPDDSRSAGITAASAGNHAIAAAWAARRFGLSAKVVMQSTANPYRVARARAENAEVIMKDGGAAAIGEAERLAREEGRTFIHPFEGIDTTLGTAGVGLEFLEDVPELDAVVVSVGGGGLISGIAAAVKAVNPGCTVYGVEPAGADSMSRSLEAGTPVTLDRIETIADSLAPPMALPFGHAVCAAYVDSIVTVTDDEICAGMLVLQEDGKLAAEPAAGAVVAGSLWPLSERLTDKRVGLVICGANIDATTFGQHLSRGKAYVAERAEFVTPRG